MTRIANDPPPPQVLPARARPCVALKLAIVGVYMLPSILHTGLSLLSPALVLKLRLRRQAHWGDRPPEARHFSNVFTSFIDRIKCEPLFM